MTPKNWYYSGSLPIFALSVIESLQIVCRWMSDKGPGIQNLMSAATTRSLLLPKKVWNHGTKSRQPGGSPGNHGTKFRPNKEMNPGKRVHLM